MSRKHGSDVDVEKEHRYEVPSFVTALEVKDIESKFHSEPPKALFVNMKIKAPIRKQMSNDKFDQEIEVGTQFLRLQEIHSHSIALFEDGKEFKIYIFGGVYDDELISNKVLRLTHETGKNETSYCYEELHLNSELRPYTSFNHETVIADQEIYMFGGIVT